MADIELNNGGKTIVILFTKEWNMDGSKNILSRSGPWMLPDQILPCRKWNSGKKDKINCFQHSHSKLQLGFPVGLALIDDTYLIHDSTEEPLTQTAGGGETG